MLRGFSRVSRLLLAFSCVSLLAASAQASPIVIDDFGGTMLGVRMIPPTDGVIFVGNPCCDTFDFVGGTSVLLRYTNLGGEDLTVSSNNAFLIDIVSIVPLIDDFVDLKVEVIDTLGGMSEFSGPVNAGEFTVLYSTFVASAMFSDADFSQVEELRFTFSAPAFAITLDDIQAVPEPGTAVLLGLGLFGLAVAGRRQAA